MLLQRRLATWQRPAVALGRWGRAFSLGATAPSLKSAMRSFYKRVHPDRFHAHPDAKLSNEKSMQQLQELLLIPASGQDTTHSGQLLHHSLVSTVATNMDLEFFVHDTAASQEASEKEEEDTEASPLRRVQEQFRGHLPRDLVQSRHKHHVRKVQEALMAELKRTLSSLFGQAELPREFTMPHSLSYDSEQLFGGGASHQEDELNFSSAQTSETVRKIAAASFFRRFGPEALQRMQRRAELERKAGMHRAVLHMQRQVLVHFVFARQFEQSAPLPAYGAYDDDPVSADLPAGDKSDRSEKHRRTFRASTDIYGNYVVERQCDALGQFVVTAKTMPDSVRDCVVVFTDLNDNDLVDVSGRIVLPYEEGHVGWEKRLRDVDMGVVEAHRQGAEELGAAERKVAAAVGFKLVCAATPSLAASAEYREVLDRLAGTHWKLNSAEGNRELFGRIPILVCEEGAPDALTADPDVGLIIPPSVTQQQLQQLIEERAGWCGRRQLFRESSAEQEGQLVMEMKRRLRLKGLRRDTHSVSTQGMLDCCIRLRRLTDNSAMDLSGLSLVIADRYRIMDDGTVVMPWNFVN